MSFTLQLCVEGMELMVYDWVVGNEMRILFFF